MTSIARWYIKGKEYEYNKWKKQIKVKKERQKVIFNDFFLYFAKLNGLTRTTHTFKMLLMRGNFQFFSFFCLASLSSDMRMCEMVWHSVNHHAESINTYFSDGRLRNHFFSVFSLLLCSLSMQHSVHNLYKF